MSRLTIVCVIIPATMRLRELNAHTEADEYPQQLCHMIADLGANYCAIPAPTNARIRIKNRAGVYEITEELGPGCLANLAIFRWARKLNKKTKIDGGGSRAIPKTTQQLENTHTQINYAINYNKTTNFERRGARPPLTPTHACPKRNCENPMGACGAKCGLEDLLNRLFRCCACLWFCCVMFARLGGGVYVALQIVTGTLNAHLSLLVIRNRVPTCLAKFYCVSTMCLCWLGCLSAFSDVCPSACLLACLPTSWRCLPGLLRLSGLPSLPLLSYRSASLLMVSLCLLVCDDVCTWVRIHLDACRLLKW